MASEPTERDIERARELLSDGIYAETFTRVATALAEARAEGARESKRGFLLHVIGRVESAMRRKPAPKLRSAVRRELNDIGFEVDAARAAEAGAKDA